MSPPAMARVRGVPVLPRRASDSHKGTYGHVLVVGGALGMTGAPALAAEAALRAGSGLVTCACPAHLNPVLEVKLTEAMTWPLPIDQEGCLNGEAVRLLANAANRFSAAVLGPGLGRQRATIEFVRGFLSEVHIPTVVDADALRTAVELTSSRPNVILTPHPGEFGSMTDRTARQVQEDRREAAFAFVRERADVLVLKGFETIVAVEDRFYVNDTGNPGMATGGAGDVLSGIIGGLLGQGFEPFDGACLGVWLHGRAGDMARDALGEDSMIAGDILSHLPAAARERKSDTTEGGNA